MSSSEGLNDRVELLNELRFYFRYEEALLREGWVDESDFREIIEETVREYAILLLKERK